MILGEVRCEAVKWSEVQSGVISQVSVKMMVDYMVPENQCSLNPLTNYWLLKKVSVCWIYGAHLWVTSFVFVILSAVLYCCSQLSYVGQDCWKIPPVLGQMYGTKALFLDLSFNCLTTLQGVENFSNLEELVLDNNKLCDSILVPWLPNLQILSLNKNNVSLMNVVCCELVFVSLYVKLRVCVFFLTFITM